MTTFSFHIVTRPILRFLLPFFFAALSSAAGSLAPDPLLGTLPSVRAAVSIGDLSYEPIPGLNVTALRQAMKVRCEESLRTAGLEVSEASESLFSVTLDHAWAGAARESVALLVTLELTVPGAPLGPSGSPTGAAHHRSLRIWAAARLVLAQAGDAEKAILEAVDLAMVELGESRRAAQAP